MKQSLALSHQLDLCLLSAALVNQNDETSRHLIQHLREEGVERSILHEIILQSYLHDGYATALEGVALLAKLWPAESQSEIESYAEWETWRDRGEELFKEIYGDVSERVRQGVAQASPELASWMLYEGYGKVLSRPGVDTATRELCTVAVLIMKKRPKQLFSHLRGAVRVGVSFSSIESLIDLLESELGRGSHIGLARDQLTKLNP